MGKEVKEKKRHREDEDPADREKRKAGKKAEKVRKNWLFNLSAAALLR